MSDQLDNFIRAYAETALWSSQDEHGEYLNRQGIADLADSAWVAMRQDCSNFCQLVRQAGHEALLADPQVAHDFWLTRNGHGAGYWDGDYPEPAASALTVIAHSFGSADLYRGDDGLVYQAGSEYR